ncbi:MAG: hypothetical protein ACPKPY_13380 [Nitrososphaeraceae archaeon]
MNIDIKNDRKMDDHSNWQKLPRITDYLLRIDKIPHRREGEQVLREIIPKKQEEFLIWELEMED